MHDSTSCRQQIEAIGKQLLDEVRGNPEREQQLLNQLLQVQRNIAAIKVSNLSGTAHPMAVISRVQDTQGRLLARKKIKDLDGSYILQHKRQKQTGSSQ